jgi:hypothetical protein
MKIPILNWNNLFEYYPYDIDDKNINHVYHKLRDDDLKCRVMNNNYFGIVIKYKIK